jgi:hypothetical protein
VVTRGRVAICADPDVAAVLLGQGAGVVLVGTDWAPWAPVLAAPRPAGGRVAVLIGDRADPAVAAAARAMAEELFGGAPVVVDTVSHARQLDPGSGTVDAHPDQ